MLLFILFFFAKNPALHINATNLTSTKGQLLFAIYNKESTFLDVSKAVRTQSFRIEELDKFKINFDDLPAGEYAIGLAHDLNGNGKLDVNVFGVPTEPYGFSNNTRPKFRAASWAEAKFVLSEKGGVLDIKLDKW
jgi:uncharacterized protein (DUF2141 family)